MVTEANITKRESSDIQNAERIRPGHTYVPQVDIIEKSDRLLLLADVPGVRSEDLEISYDNGQLTIHGKVEPRQDPEETRFAVHEYGVGDFYRVFQVGESLDPTKIEAVLKDGVLTLHLPKAEDALPRRISVKTE